MNTYILSIQGFMTEQLICDFCGKEENQVEKIFSAEKSNICNECVDTCCDILDKTRVQKEKAEFHKGISIHTKNQITPKGAIENIRNYLLKYQTLNDSLL